MPKLKTDQKIINYLNNILKDENLFKDTHYSYSCVYHYIDKENDIEVVLGDYSVFYDGYWLYPGDFYLELNKIRTYNRYGFIGKDKIIDNKKWKIPYTTICKAMWILCKIKKQVSRNYRNGIAKENMKNNEKAKDFAKTLPVYETKKWWQIWKKS